MEKSEDSIVSTERIASDVMRITVKSVKNSNAGIDDVQAAFDRAYGEGISQIIFDMSDIEFPSGSFIAMLIGRTMEARRRGGDVKIVGLSEMAQNNLSIFTPLTYLSIGLDEIVALEDVEKVHPSLIEEFVQFREGEPCSLHLGAVVDSLNTVTHFVGVLAEKSEMEPLDVSKLKIAVYEACMNVIEHGYRFEPNKMMEVEVLLKRKRFTVVIRDWGESFDFNGVRPYDVHEAYHERREGGFGLYIIQKSVDEVKYESDPEGGNRLTLVKKIGKKGKR